MILRHVQFDSVYNVMTVNAVPWYGPEIIFGFRIIWCWVRFLWWWRRESAWFSWKNFLFLSSFRTTVDGLRRRSPPGVLTVPSATGNTAFWRGFQMRPSAPTLQCLLLECLLSRFAPRLMHIHGMYLARLLDHIDLISIVFGRNRVIFDHCSKRYYWSVKGHSEPPFI